MEKKPKRSITIQLNAETDKLSAKLQAIAKHAKALADELDQIDKATCPECGGELEEIEIYGDDQGPYIISKCIECGLSNTLDEIEDN